MKRTGDWPRKKRLQAKAELRNKTPFESGRTPLTTGPGPRRVEMVAKPKKRAPGEAAAEKLARKLVRARSGGICEVCGRQPSREFQHRKAQVHGGEYSAVNGLDVCGHGNYDGCHGHIHQHPAIAYEQGWSVRSGHNPAVQPVWLAGRGRVLLRADGSTEPYGKAA